jgi:hypothetical protein
MVSPQLCVLSFLSFRLRLHKVATSFFFFFVQSLNEPIIGSGAWVRETARSHTPPQHKKKALESRKLSRFLNDTQPWQLAVVLRTTSVSKERFSPGSSIRKAFGKGEFKSGLTELDPMIDGATRNFL